MDMTPRNSEAVLSNARLILPNEVRDGAISIRGGIIADISGTAAQADALGDRGALQPDLRADLIRFRMVNGVPVVRGVWVKGERAA